MPHNIPPPKRKTIAVLRARVAHLSAELAAVAADLAAVEPEQAPDDPLLDRCGRREAYPGAASAIEAAIRSGELSAVRGSRQRALVRRSDVDRWLAGRTIDPRPPRKTTKADDLDSWDEQVARELGGRR